LTRDAVEYLANKFSNRPTKISTEAQIKQLAVKEKRNDKIRWYLKNYEEMYGIFN
jgi:hypothetical protein